MQTPRSVKSCGKLAASGKMRFAFEQQGKSGSVRVIYVDFEVYEKLYLLTAYPKNEKDNLSKAERNTLKQLVGILKQQLDENRRS